MALCELCGALTGGIPRNEPHSRSTAKVGLYQVAGSGTSTTVAGTVDGGNELQVKVRFR